MRLAWATGIHLNFLTTMARRRFLESIRDQADALVRHGRGRTAGVRPTFTTLQNILVSHLLHLRTNSEMSRRDLWIEELDYGVLAVTRDSHLVQSGDTRFLFRHVIPYAREPNRRTKVAFCPAWSL